MTPAGEGVVRAVEVSATAAVTSGELAERIEAHLDRAYRLAKAILADGGEAEDAVQEASLLAWRRGDSLRDPTRFEAWFERILVNHCRDRLRRRKRQQIRAIALQAVWAGEEGAQGPTSVTALDPDDLRLDLALEALDLDHRLVVILRYWRDLTAEQIAERLDIPSGTVKSRLHQALKQLRAAMEASDGRS